VTEAVEAVVHMSGHLVAGELGSEGPLDVAH
jgi:hypothetical protein